VTTILTSWTRCAVNSLHTGFDGFCAVKSFAVCFQQLQINLVECFSIAFNILQLFSIITPPFRAAMDLEGYIL